MFDFAGAFFVYKEDYYAKKQKETNCKRFSEWSELKDYIINVKNQKNKLTKTKLAKLLWYIDFIFFKNTI